MNQFVLTTPSGERYATLADLPLTRAGEAMVIGALLVWLERVELARVPEVS